MKNISRAAVLCLTFFLLSLWAAPHTHTASASTVTYGDVNDDGRVDVDDAFMILRGVVGLEELTPAARRRADVAYDHSVGVRDAILILQHVASGSGSTNFPVEQIDTDQEKIIGEPKVSVNTAQRWAASRDAHDRFIDIAPVYWEYGAKTGIRPDVLYAQSAKETAFGNYGGVVIPEYNNWAGIKVKEGGPCGELESHEEFDTPEDGVRAHFNHMSAYVGVDPVGDTHGRYSLVASLEWSGTIKFVEQLGARWAPSAGYGDSVANHYLQPLVYY